MLIIRLQRTGRKNEPYFRVILTDHKNSAKTGKFLEILGHYDPKKGEVIFKADRVNHWLKMGAKTSDTIHNFLVSQKIIEGKKKNVLPKKSPIIDEAKIKAEAEAKAKAEADAKAAKEAEEAAKAAAEAEPEVAA